MCLCIISVVVLIKSLRKVSKKLLENEFKSMAVDVFFYTEIK